jgi:DNA-binding response OmpR family regulator
VSTLVLAIMHDNPLRESILRHLRDEGLTALGASSVSEGVAMARQAGPSSVLLDRELVEGRSPSVSQELRWEGSPLVLLLDSNGSSADAVAALESGADDYVRLPCSMVELMARIISLLRRRRLPGGSAATEIHAGDLSVSLPQRQVTLRGRPVSLAPKEFEILAALAQRANRVVSREELVRLVWTTGRSVKRQTLDVYLFSLRSKIEDDPEHPARLLTVRGVGYRLIAPDETPIPSEPAVSSPTDSAPCGR